MKKSLLLFCLFWVPFCGAVLAQAPINDLSPEGSSYRNSVYLELGGNGIVGSVNYERLLPVSERVAVALRVGGFYLPDGKKNYAVGLPAEGSMIYGKKALKFEAGLGYTYFKYADQEHGNFEEGNRPDGRLIPVLRLGSRRQIADSPFFFRSAFTFLFIESVTLGKFPIPWLGLSAGYSFGKK